MTDQPLLSVCQLSLPDTTFEEDLALLAASGTPGISIAEHKVTDRDAQVAALAKSGIRASACVPKNISPLPPRPPEIYPGPEDPDERVALMIESIELLAAFKPDSIVMITGSNQGYDAGRAWHIAVEAMREAVRVASAHEVKIAVEFCRNDVGNDFTFLNNLADAVRFIDDVGGADIGICYDFYHGWDTDNALADAERFADRILAVQYNDWREPPRCGADRLLPGDGSMDIPGLLNALDKGGFAGWYDLEIFSDDGRWGHDLPDSLWKLPPAEMIARGEQGLLRAWNARHGQKVGA